MAQSPETQATPLKRVRLLPLAPRYEFLASLRTFASCCSYYNSVSIRPWQPKVLSEPLSKSPKRQSDSSSSGDSGNSIDSLKASSPRRFRLFSSRKSGDEQVRESSRSEWRQGNAVIEKRSEIVDMNELAADVGQYVQVQVDLVGKHRVNATRKYSDPGSVFPESLGTGKSRSQRPRRLRNSDSVVTRAFRRMSYGKALAAEFASVFFNGRQLGEVKFTKPNPMVSDVRLILCATFRDLAQSTFSFWYSNDEAEAVDVEDEENTRISDCLDENVLCINTMEFINDDLDISDLQMTDHQLRDISPGAESVIRCCFRLLEDAVVVQVNEKHNPALPKLAKTCARLVKLIARATVDSRSTKENPASPGVKWYFLELLLHRVEEQLVLCNSRHKVAEWWFYCKDQNGLLDTIRRTQDAFRSSPNLPINHPLFRFKLPKLGASAAHLVEVLHKVKPIQFTGKKYDSDREKLARYLGVSEAQLRSAILSKKERIFLDDAEESPLFFRPSAPGKGDRATLNKRNGSINLKETLGPLFELQETFIDDMVSEFCLGTREWAFDAFDHWMSDPRTSNRSFIFMAPPGSGKTFFASKLVRSRSKCIMAYHFCRHDDNRFRISKIMLLSLIFQLSLQSPHYERRLRVLLAEKGLTRKQLLGPNSSIKMIFTDLIASPLFEIPVPASDKFVIVVDGIDEAKDGVDGTNEILETIQGMFLRLPSWISFCFTTRKKLPILRKLRKFNARMISPTPDQNERDFKHFFHVACGGRNESGPGFGGDDVPSILALNAGESFLSFKLMLTKLHECQNQNQFEDCAMLKLENLLRAECFEICADDPALFWRAVQLCMVAVEPLDIEVLRDLHQGGNILDMLSRSKSFFSMKRSIVRFVHKVSKDWLLNELGNADVGNFRRERRISFSGCSPKSGLNRQSAVDEVTICHIFFARQVKRLMFCDDDTPAEMAQMSRDYLLRHGVHHLALGRMFNEVKDLILNPAWLLLHASDLDGIVQSCELLSDVDQVLALVARAVSLSGEASRQDPRQLIGQLVGRLIAVTKDGHSDSLVQECMTKFLGDLRSHDYGFQWWCPVGPTWDQAEQAYLRTMDGHKDSIQSAAWHCGGRRCATGSWDHDIRVWDTVTGICSDILIGHSNTVWAIDWEPNGRRLASASMDMSARIWDVDAGFCEHVLIGHEDCVWDVRWSLDAKAIASASKDQTIRIWDPADGSCVKILSGNSGLVYSISWEAGINSRICSGSTDNCVRIWNSQSAKCEAILSGHTDWVRSVDWCKSGQYVLSASADQTVRVWDADTFECEHVLMGHSDTVWSVSTSPDGRYAVSGSSDGSVRVWDCVNGRAEQVLEGHKGAVWSVAFCPDSKRVVSGSADKSLILWDATVGLQKQAVSGHGQPIWCIDASVDGSKIVSGSADKTARLWNAQSGLCEKVFSGHTGPVFAIKFSANGKLLATASSDNTAAVYRIKTGERQFQLIGHTGAVWCVAWSADDSMVFTGSKDTTIRAWDVFTGRCKFQLAGHTADVKGISISLDGKQLASGSTDATIRVWDLATKSSGPVLARHDTGVVCVDWNPKDKALLVAGYISGSVSVWNTSTGEREVDFLPGHARRTNAVSWSPDGQKVVSVSSDKEIRIWSMEDHHCEKKILASTVGIFGVIWTARYIISCGADKSIRLFNPGNTRCEVVLAGDDRSSLGILDVAMSKDGKYAVSGNRRGIIQIWNAATGICEKSLSGHTNWVHRVFFDEDGKRVLSRSDDGTMRLWDVASGECLMVNEDADMTPQGFVVVPKPALRSLSGPGEKDRPVGVLCDKVRVEEGKACGWIGKQMYFFELMGQHPIVEEACESIDMRLMMK
jgi:WD40 repeat protein